MMGWAARVKRRGCSGPHTMVGSVVDGWSVCAVCGLVAVCPGCVDVVDEVRVHLCERHGYLSHVDGMAARMVWAVEKNASDV